MTREELRAGANSVTPDTPPPSHRPKSADHLIPQESKFTDKVKQVILTAVSHHHPAASAAALGGITARTLQAWLYRGAQEEDSDPPTPFAQFRTEFMRADAIAAGRALKTIEGAADRGNVDAAKFILERRHGWVKTEKVEHAGDASQPILVQLTWPTSGLHAELGDSISVGNHPPALGEGDASDVIDVEVVDETDLESVSEGNEYGEGA